MRRLFSILIVCLALGCRNQSMPLSNPFLAPDRVPPPATRTILPGTAQPYYPGDPVPNSPAVGVPAPVLPPGTSYGPAPTYAPPQTTPTSPPGGWNTYQPSGPVSSAPADNGFNNVVQASAEAPFNPPTGETVQVPTDNESLRFAATTQPQIESASYGATPLAASEADQFLSVHNAVAPAQHLQQQSPVIHREVSIREITSAELPGLDGDTSSAVGTLRDGFRPQGSSRISREGPKSTVRPASATLPSAVAPVQEPIQHYGFDPQYRWLRGQLVYTPTTGQWYLQYIPPGAAPDSFGGSVPITNPQVLGALQPGEHVSVEGRLEMLQLDAMSVVPAYTISVLQRQQQALR